MKKNILRFSLLLFILLVTIAPSIAKASTATYSYNCSYIYYSTMKSNGELQDISALTSGFYVNTKFHDGYSVFFVHMAKQGGRSYLMYCKDMGKFADTELNNYTLVGNSNDGSIAAGSGLSEAKRKMLEDLFSNGYHFDISDTATSLNTKNDRLSAIAMQLLVWEVTEGARTDWNASGSGGDIYAPTRQYTANSYDKIIKPNGCPTAPEGTVKSGTLCAAYRNIIDNVRKATKASSATAFDKTYTMKWNSSKQKYYLEVPGLDIYKSCTSNNAKITVTVSGTKAILTSDKTFDAATITCQHIAGQGTSGTTKPFVVYEYRNCPISTGCQGFVYGGGTKIYSKKFTVGTEKSEVKILKKNTSGASVDGAVFNLSLQNDASHYNFNLDGNGGKKYITASGTYKVSEKTAPSGYSKIADFTISLDLPSQKITACTNKSTNSSGQTTCLNGQVTVTFENNLITMTVVDTAKNFKIKKVDSTGKNGIKGATFQIKNKSGTVMKFKNESGIFVYNTSGTVTDLKIDSSYSYPISLLPDGEYQVVETAVPAPYVLASSEAERTTWIKVSDGTLSVYDESQKKYVVSSDASVSVKNYKTEVNILKTGNGKSLEGVVFVLYKEDKETFVNSGMTSAGVYDYSGTSTDTTTRTSYVTNNKGNIKVNNLPEGKYYFKEIQTVEPFQVPTGDAAFTEVTITVTKSGVKVNNKSQNTIAISNSANSFNFYKVDEDGNYLTSGKFKIQKWDDDKDRYVDIRVSSVQNDGTYDERADIFQPDDKGKVKFSLKNGIGTFINMPSSTKYRIVETDAPEGYEIGDASEGAEVTIDKYGNSSGLLILTNQKISTEEGDASAELIVNIATGQNRVPWALIIGGVVIIIGGLISVVMYLNKKGQKK